MKKILQTYLDIHQVWQERFGRLVAWGVLSLVIITALVVILRYGFDTGSIALQETITYNHAILFMLGISYTYLHDGHVRVDVFYSHYSPQRKCLIDMLGSLIFTIPVAIFIIWSSWDYIAASWAIFETSSEAGGLAYVYLLKSLIIVMAVLLLLQAKAIIARSLLHLDTNEDDIPAHEQGGKL